MSAIVRTKGVMPSLLCERSALLLCGLGLALANALYAQSVSKNGGEYSLSGPRAGDQTVPSISVGPNGGYVVWQDNAIDGPGNSYGIAARKLFSDLTSTSGVFRVNKVVAGPQENPQVALLKNGAASFVWQGGKLGSQDIFFRTLTLKGAWVPATTDLRVNTFAAGQQSTPVITSLSNGNLAVAWCSLHQDKSFEGVFARILTPMGVFVTAPFRVNQFTGYNQRNPAVAALDNGNFAVVWVSENQGVSTLEIFQHTNRVHIYGRVFSKTGVGLGPEFRINTRSNICANPSIAPSGPSGFAVTWAEKSDDKAESWEIYARPFSDANAPSGDVVRVNSITYGDQFAPKIARAGSEHFVVWNAFGHDGSREGVFGRALSGGAVNGPEYLVNTQTNSSQIHPIIAGNGKDQFVAAWSSFMGLSSFDIEAQRFQILESPGPEPSTNSSTASGLAQSDGVIGPTLPGSSLGTTVSSPNDAASSFRVSLANTSKGKMLSWNTEAGGLYQVQYSTNCAHWESLGEPRPGMAPADWIVVGNGEAAAFYRVIRLK